MSSLFIDPCMNLRLGIALCCHARFVYGITKMGSREFIFGSNYVINQHSFTKIHHANNSLDASENYAHNTYRVSQKEVPL